MAERDLWQFSHVAGLEDCLCTCVNRTGLLGLLYGGRCARNDRSPSSDPRNCDGVLPGRLATSGRSTSTPADAEGTDWAEPAARGFTAFGFRTRV